MNKEIDLFSIEQWRDVVGYEGLYQVSTLGRVRSLDKWVWNGKGYSLRRGRILKPQLDRYGYQQVNLYKDGKGKTLNVHRLVVQAFLPNPQHFKEINHLNEVKTDNRVENLEWCDRNYNCNFGSRNERVAKAKSKRVAQINPQTDEIIRIWPSTMECQRYGFNQGNVAACCRGKLKTHHGFKWQYIEDSI